MVRIFNSADAAAQFLFLAGLDTPIASFVTQIASTLFEVGWISPSPTVSNVTYTPNGEHLVSRLGGELAAFDIPVPFP